jgi:hypothetical protein
MDASCRWHVESGQLMYSSTSELVPTCVYTSYRPYESFVPEQQRKQRVSVVYCWRRNVRQYPGVAGKHRVLCDDWQKYYPNVSRITIV